jgi:hypothetical protein
VLFEAMVDFQGKTVPSIRVRAPTAKDRTTAAQAPTQQAEDRITSGPIRQRDRHLADEEVPF